MKAKDRRTHREDWAQIRSFATLYVDLSCVESRGSGRFYMAVFNCVVVYSLIDKTAREEL